MRLIAKIFVSPVYKISFGVILLFILYLMYLLSVIFWLSTFMLYLAVWLIISASLDYFVKNRFILRLLKSNFAIFTVLMLTLDVGLRIYGEKKNYFEKSGSFFYKSMYAEKDKSGLIPEFTAESTYNSKAKEFNYRRELKKMGIRQKEIPDQKETNEYRIFALGDGFTKGEALPLDSTYPAMMERCLQDHLHKKNLSVFNAGVEGSDMLFMDRLFARKLADYHPDGVVFMVNPTDMWKIATRGGRHRYKSNNRLELQEAPLTEMIFASSFIYRHILMDVLQYDYNTMSKEEMETAIKRAAEVMRTSMGHIEGYCFKQKIDLLWVLAPTKPDVERELYTFEPFRQFVKKTSFDVYLLPEFIMAKRREGLATEDLFLSNAPFYSAKGNSVIADAICRVYQYKYLSGTKKNAL